VRRLIVMILFFPWTGFSQTITINGIIKDSNADKLPHAHVVILPDSVVALSDLGGIFSIKVKPGVLTVQASYTGYKTQIKSFTVKKDTTVSFVLIADVNQLNEVVVRSDRYQEQLFNSTRSGTQIIDQNDINAIPVLGGEADLIKTLQLLPGTIRGVEGSSDLFVRGGAADQNLVLLDGAPIYNTSHLFGFLSVFNPDVLDKVEAINGGFPARYGGRLSSILDVKTTSEVAQQTHLSGDIGLIASRLYFEQPIVKDKASFWIAGRRTYIDQVLKTIGQELPYFFYDLNGKLILKPTARNQVTISYYTGDDKLDLFRDRNGDGDGFLTQFYSGNSSQSIQWKHSGIDGWDLQTTLIRSKYRYNITNKFEENELLANSNIEDLGASVWLHMDSIGNASISVTSGLEWTRHSVSPNVVNTSGTISELFKSSETSGRIANEISAFAEGKWSPADNWQLTGGMRTSLAAVNNKNYVTPEPRFSARYALTENQNLKVSYSRMAQYMHRISNSAVSSPTDIWYPVTDSIRPQTSHQVSAAWQRLVPSKNIFVSVEAYYKTMNQLIGYEEGTNLFLNTDFESKLIQGRGRAYGLEFLIRKKSGKLTGWVSYTLSWTWRQFDQINSGEWFPSRYDRRHNGAIVAQYALNKRWFISGVWEFVSGSRFTPVIGQYVVFAPTLTGVDLIPVYSGINEVKLSNTHRLDLGLKFKSKSEKKFQWQLFAGVYNSYNRANPIGINIQQNPDGSLRYEQPGLFGLLPFISYGFKL
jgi:outer membrane cobalamin receptor